MLHSYRKEFDDLVRFDWNTGCCFGINKWMSYREPGQTCMDINSDVNIVSSDWLTPMLDVVNSESMGVVAGRRPEFWIDRPDKFQMLKSGVVRPAKINGHWCEIVDNGTIIGPFWMIRGELIDQIGFMNEADGYDDIDYGPRVYSAKWTSCYCVEPLFYQPQDEVQDHPQYGSHKALLNRNKSAYYKYISQYTKGKDLFCGTRWLPETMKDTFYKEMADSNWEFLKNWAPKGGANEIRN